MCMRCGTRQMWFTSRLSQKWTSSLGPAGTALSKMPHYQESTRRQENAHIERGVIGLLLERLDFERGRTFALRNQSCLGCSGACKTHDYGTSDLQRG